MERAAAAISQAWDLLPVLPPNPYMNDNQAKLIAVAGATALFIQSTLFAYRKTAQGKMTPVGRIIQGKLVAFINKMDPREGSRESLPDAVSGDEARRPNDLRDDVTVLMTTSPLKINPSCALIEHTMETTHRFAEGLKSCRTIIICDGVRIAETCRYRRGEVTEEAAGNYAKYIEKLKALSTQKSSAVYGAEIVVLGHRHGFGMALKEGMALVETEFVVVLQHDRDFRRLVAVPRVVRSMRHFNRLKCVSFPTSTTDPRKYIQKVQGSYNLAVAPYVIHDDANMSTFVPLVQWYDSAHIASTKHYREFVFSTEAKRVSKGGFIEDQLGQLELQHIKDDGVGAAHPFYGNYVLNDGNSVNPVRHLDGHDSRIERKLAADNGAEQQREQFVYGC